MNVCANTEVTDDSKCRKIKILYLEGQIRKPKESIYSRPSNVLPPGAGSFPNLSIPRSVHRLKPLVH